MPTFSILKIYSNISPLTHNNDTRERVFTSSGLFVDFTKLSSISFHFISELPGTTLAANKDYPFDPGAKFKDYATNAAVN